MDKGKQVGKVVPHFVALTHSHLQQIRAGSPLSRLDFTSRFKYRSFPVPEDNTSNPLAELLCR